MANPRAFCLALSIKCPYRAASATDGTANKLPCDDPIPLRPFVPLTPPSLLPRLLLPCSPLSFLALRRAKGAKRRGRQSLLARPG